MGFLDSIGTLLGGWHDVEMGNKYGPDWRAQKAKSDFALQQQQAEEERAAREFERQQEEALARQASNILIGAPQGGEEGPLPEPDIASMLPQEVSTARRKWIAGQASGLAAQTKPALQAQQFFNQQQRDAARAAATAEQIGLRGDEAQELARLRAKLQAERTLSPAEQATLDSLERRAAEIAAARREGAGPGGGRQQLRQVRDAQGNTVWRWLRPGEEAQAPATAVERQAAGMAETVKQNVGEMERLAPDVTSGRLLGNVSKASQWLFGPHGKEGDFDFDANAVVDIVYVKSGKQINQTEMQILRSLIPDRAKGNLPNQVRMFKDYANSLLQKYGATGGTEGGGGGGQTATFGGVQYRLKPGANPKLKSSWEPIR